MGLCLGGGEGQTDGLQAKIVQAAQDEVADACCNLRQSVWTDRLDVGLGDNRSLCLGETNCS